MTYLLHFFLFALIYFGYFFPIYQKDTREKIILHSVMFNYLLIVLSLTVIPLAIPTIPWEFNQSNIIFLQAINFIPFRDIIHGYAFAKREALFNVFMLIPFGILFPLLTNRKWLETVIVTFLFSLTIETTQLFTILFQSDQLRIVDVTDVITNTIGGMCGYIIFFLFIKVKQKIPYRC